MKIDRHFRKIEDWLEQWIEGSVSRFFDSQLTSMALASNLVKSMEREVRTNQSGIRHAPEHYTVYLNPSSLERLQADIFEISGSLIDGLEKMAEQYGYILYDKVSVEFNSDPDLHTWEIRSFASYQPDELDETQRFNQGNIHKTLQLPQGAFLIIDGGRHFALDKPVINIGRRADNHIVLDNSRVSRVHAQLRVRDGRYILIDVGSKTGTFVHGQRITQHILRTGDVITIAKIELVYGEEILPGSDETMALQPNTFPPKNKKPGKGT